MSEISATLQHDFSQLHQPKIMLLVYAMMLEVLLHVYLW
jgi:hypothetical protein